MRQSYNLLNSEWDINKVNDFLVEKYCYDLHDFAYSLAVILSKKPLLKFWDIQLKTKQTTPDYEIVVEGVERLKKMDHDLIAYRSAMRKIRNPLFLRKKISNIEESISDEINIHTACLKMHEKIKGRPAKPINIIAGLWSLVMRDSEGIHFKNIEILLDWFYEKLEEVTYRDKLNLDKVDSLKAVILRFVKNFRPYLEKDKKDIFVHNYKTNLSKGIKKTYAFQIRFKKDNPKICRLSPKSKDDISSLIIFLRK